MATFSHATRGVAVTSVLVAILAACSPSPSPTPIASGAPSGEPTASPVVDTVPSPEPSTGPGAKPVAGLPAGWGHEITCNDNGRRCRLHLYDERRREVPGWPVALADGCWENPPATAPDGTGYVVCSGKRGVIVHAFDTRGRVVEGWPVRLDGRESYASWNTFDDRLPGGWRPRLGWYKVSNVLISGTEPMTIPAGGSIERTWGLSGQLSDCLTPGAYRFRVDYRRLSGDGGGLIASDTIDFTVTERP